MIFLDANNPSQVDSARLIEVLLGGPNRKVIIFSGIACPAWRVNDDEHIYRETTIVNLRRSVLAIDQATVTVGLASVGNDDTTFLIAADNADLDIDPKTNELLLRVDMALKGEDTGLMRFGYQIVTVVTTQTTGVSGTIKWYKPLFDATGMSLADMGKLFKISANEVKRITPPSGFVYDEYTPVASGVPIRLSTDKEDFLVPYEISGAPYNVPLTVTVDVSPLFATGKSCFATQIAGPKPIVITPIQPSITGVDFRVFSQSDVKVGIQNV